MKTGRIFEHFERAEVEPSRFARRPTIIVGHEISSIPGSIHSPTVLGNLAKKDTRLKLRDGDDICKGGWAGFWAGEAVMLNVVIITRRPLRLPSRRVCA